MKCQGWLRLSVEAVKTFVYRRDLLHMSFHPLRPAGMGENNFSANSPQTIQNWQNSHFFVSLVGVEYRRPVTASLFFFIHFLYTTLLPPTSFHTSI
jgi:hypothetical protein